MLSRDRAATGAVRSKVARNASERIAFIFLVPRRMDQMARPFLIGLQRSDVLQDRIDLRFAEDLAKSRHRALLAELDAVAEEVVTARRIHELRPLAGGPAAIGMTIAAGRREQLTDIGRRFVRRGSGLLRRDRDAASDGYGDTTPIGINARTHKSRLIKIKLACTNSLNALGSAACADSPAEDRNGLFQAVDDERAIVPRHARVDPAKRGSVVVRRHAAKTRRHGDVLLAVDGVADDPALVAGTVRVLPQLGAGFGIVSVEHPAGIRHEHEIARRR